MELTRRSADVVGGALSTAPMRHAVSVHQTYLDVTGHSECSFPPKSGSARRDQWRCCLSSAASVSAAFARTWGGGRFPASSPARSSASGGAGAAEDWAEFARHPWGFELAELNRPVHLWFGTADRIVPVAQGRHLASLLPNPVVHEIPGEGHLLIFAQFDDILSSLASSVSA